MWDRLILIGAKFGVPVEIEPSDDIETSARAALMLAHAQEITRYGGMEIHNISSLMGGIVAQVLKL